MERQVKIIKAKPLSELPPREKRTSKEKKTPSSKKVLKEL